jgi:hypothetical protein
MPQTALVHSEALRQVEVPPRSPSARSHLRPGGTLTRVTPCSRRAPPPSRPVPGPTTPLLHLPRMLRESVPCPALHTPECYKQGSGSSRCFTTLSASTLSATPPSKLSPAPTWLPSKPSLSSLAPPPSPASFPSSRRDLVSPMSHHPLPS